MTTSEISQTTDQRPMSQRMREGCWDLHQAAESATFAQRMTRGDLTREEYAAMLAQSLAPMRRLDQRLVDRRADVPALDAIIDDNQLHAPRLDRDLEFLGAEAPSSTTPAAQALIDLIDEADRTDPLALLGLHYVREGALNGNRFVAIKIRKALDLPEVEGVESLDPYGSEQRARWEQFKTAFDEQDLSPEQRDTLVAAGRRMFEAIIAMHAELEQSAEG